MRRCLRQFRRNTRGVGLVELLVGLAVFALFFLLIDAVFVGTHRSARKAELAGEVQQNARIAIERLSREIRESRANLVSVSSDGTRVVFKSARLLGSSTPEVFCVYVRSTSDSLYNFSCFTNLPSSKRPNPSYTFPVAGCPPPSVGTACALGTYTPLWQFWVAYWWDSSLQLHRVAGALSDPDATPPDVTNPAVWFCPGVTCGEVIATFVNTFNATINTTTGNFATTLDAQGTRIVQGSPVPQQEILLNGTTLVRN